MWGPLGHCGHKYKEAKHRDSKEIGVCHHLWGSQQGGCQAVFLTPHGSFYLILHIRPKWTLRSKCYPCLMRNKGSWNETNGYSGWKRSLIPGPILLARPALLTFYSYLLFVRLKTTYFALLLELVSLWLLSSCLGPFRLLCADCACSGCDPWLCSYLEHVPFWSSPGLGYRGSLPSLHYSQPLLKGFLRPLTL